MSDGQKGTTTKEFPGFFLTSLPVSRLIVFMLALMLLSRRAWSADEKQVSASLENGNKVERGVVVEGLAHWSEGEKAGIHEGDVLLTWSRSNERGEIQLPFDLMRIEIEQSPRGTVTLQGVRSGAQTSWVLGPDGWGLMARPDFSGELLAAHLKARELAKQAKHPKY